MFKKISLFIGSIGIILKDFIAHADTQTVQQVANTVAASDKEQVHLTLIKILDLVIETCVKYSFQVMGGLIILGVGWLIARYLSGIS